MVVGAHLPERFNLAIASTPGEAFTTADEARRRFYRTVAGARGPA